MALSNVFTADEPALLLPLTKIHFPWDLLRSGLAAIQRSSIRVEYADLSRWGQTTAAFASVGHGHTHVHDAVLGEGHPTRPDQLPPTKDNTPRPASNIAGLAWSTGLIQVTQDYRGNQSGTDWVVSAEIAHMVDFFHMTAAMRDQLARLVHGGNPPDHPWWGGPYFGQVGEAWMHGFGVSYTDFVDTDSRFGHHRFTKDKAPQVWAILNAPRTDGQTQPPPPPPRPNVYPGDLWTDPATNHLWWFLEDGTRFDRDPPIPVLTGEMRFVASKLFVICGAGVGGGPLGVIYERKTGRAIWQGFVPHFNQAGRGGASPDIKEEGGQVAWSGEAGLTVEVDPATGRVIGVDRRNEPVPAGRNYRRLIV